MDIVDLVGKLPVHATRKYALRQKSFIKGIIVHHSGTSCNCVTDLEEQQTVEGFARYHVDHNGWPGIGYHYVIAPDGTIYKTNNMTTLSYHAPGYNKATLGICVIGNFQTQTPSPQALRSLATLIAAIRMSLAWPLYVKGHRDVYSTECPGDKLEAALPK